MSEGVTAENDSSMPQNNSANLASELMRDAILSELSKYIYDKDCYVLLTEELAEHVIQMYNDTDWDDDENSEIDLPEDIFTGDMDEEKWKSYIGQHIIVTRYGEPWTDIQEAPTFVPGVRIGFSEDLMMLGADILHDIIDSENVSWCLNSLSAAINAMLLDSVPEQVIKKMFRAEYIARKK